MPYNVTFSGQTKPGEQLSKKGILVGSVPFFLEEEIKQKDFKEKVEKSQSAIRALKSAVGEVDFLVADSLVRHNFEIEGKDEKLAQGKALELGQKWMNHYETEKSLKEIGVTRIEHWKEFVLEHEIFESLKKHIQFLYEGEKEFKSKVDTTAFSRCAHLSAKEVSMPENVMEICRKYIFEECAAVLLFRYKGDYDSLIYIQGKLNDPTSYVADVEFDFNQDKEFLVKVNSNKLKLITAPKYTPVSQDNSKHLKGGKKKGISPFSPVVSQSSFFTYPKLHDDVGHAACTPSKLQDNGGQAVSLLIRLTVNNIDQILQDSNIEDVQKQILLEQLDERLNSYRDTSLSLVSS